MTTGEMSLGGAITMLIETLELDQFQINMLVQASTHPFGCRCTACLWFYARFGPFDECGVDGYAAFTSAEIEEYYNILDLIDAT